METRTHKPVRIAPKRRARSNAASFAVFTTVDGTLLDAQSLSAGPAADAVRQLIDADVPIVPVSAMTLGELEPIARELGLRGTMILEGGVAIARSTEQGWEVEPCGPPRDLLLEAVRVIEDLSGASLLLVSASDESDEAGQASCESCFGEPFVLESGDLEEVRAAAARLGLTVRRGRQFLHLCRERDEGDAVARVRAEIGCAVAVAVGASAVDGEFLARADIAIVIPGPDGELDPELLARVPNARIASGPAPHGWAAAIEEVRQTLDAPSRRSRRA